MDFFTDLDGLDGVFAPVDETPSPRRKRSLTELCAAFDRGEIEGFDLDDIDLCEDPGLVPASDPPFLPGTANGPAPPPPDVLARPAGPPPTVPNRPEPPGLGLRPWPAPSPYPGELPAPPTSGPLGGFPVPPDKLSGIQNTASAYLDLRIAPACPAAEAVIEHLLGRLADVEERHGKRLRKRRPDAQRQFRDAVGAIVGNLLRGWAGTPPVAVHRSRDVNAFDGEHVGWRAFLAAMDAMVHLGLVQHRRGGKAKDKPGGWAARYWPGVPLLRAAVEHGLDASAVGAAFQRRRPPATGKAPKVPEPLRLKEFKRHPNGRAPRLPIDPADPVAAALRAEVEAMNAFAASVRVEGCLPPRLFRQFNGDFRLFGRFTAAGSGNYQSMPASDRVGLIRIAGEPVVEVDIRASLLSMLHGQLGLPTQEGDPYELPGVPRGVAKAWVNATLGKGTPVVKWPAETLRKSPELAEHPAHLVGARALKRYPFLADPWRVAEGFGHIAQPRRILIHLLMGTESEVVLDVLTRLRAEGVLGLPMHDGIIVPASAEALACGLLRAAGERVAGVALRLKVDRPPS